MGTIYLLRHAKALGARPGTADRERALAGEGWREARAIAAALQSRAWRPARIVCSPARRTRETLQAIAEAVDAAAAVFAEVLYTGDTEDYVAAIRGAGDADSVMLIGHNPAIEGAATLLSGSRAPDAAHRLAAGFPTAGLAVIRFPCPLSDVEPRGGHLEELLTPASA